MQINDLDLADLDAIDGGNACTQSTAQYGIGVSMLIGVVAVGSGPVGWAALAIGAYTALSAVPQIEANCQ